MKIEDLVQLLNNRLREFQLSRDYARMSGDLERMNSADKEINDLEDTLFQLNLLVDTSESAAVKEATLAEIITDGSVAVLGEYNITVYATDPLHEEKIMNILSKMGVMDTVEKIDDYISGKYLSSPVTGEMIMSSASAYSVDARLMMAIIEQDSSFGTAGKAVRTLNPGNVGNDDSGNTRTYESWQEGVTAVAAWLSRHRGSTIISETPPIIIPTTTTTTSTVISTTTISTEETIPVITSTTTTPLVIPTPDLVGINSVEESLSPTTTISTSTTTTTPATTTSTPETIPVITSTTTISTEEIIPVITSTTTTATTPTSTTTPAE